MWKEKLSSRKFWNAIVGFVTAILLALNVDNLTVQQVTLVVGALGVLIAYIIAEGMVDKARNTDILEGIEVEGTVHYKTED